MNYLKMNLLNHQLINYLNQVRDMAMLLVDMMVSHPFEIFKKNNSNIIIICNLIIYTLIGGFVIYGGKVQDGSLSNELWYYNVNTRSWTLRAKNSPFYPPQLTRHTLTLANNYIYLFGGSTVDGEFSSNLYKIKLNLCKFI